MTNERRLEMLLAIVNKAKTVAEIDIVNGLATEDLPMDMLVTYLNASTLKQKELEGKNQETELQELWKQVNESKTLEDVRAAEHAICDSNLYYTNFNEYDELMKTAAYITREINRGEWG